jgi:NAD(P)-dependent dehydrogenase (short-subunit alcohol dehydrogenase family)
MRVCIVGASGKLGQYMVQHALDRGYEVVGVCREQSVGKLDKFKGRITVVPGATNDPDVIRRAIAGCDGVLVVLVPRGVHGYSTGTAQAVLDHAPPGARLVFSCGWHITRDGQDVYSWKLKALVKIGGPLARLARFADLNDQVEACNRVFASETRWTVVRGSDLEEGESQGLPVWSRHVGDPILESNITRRVDFALFMVAALENDELIHEAPAIVSRQSARRVGLADPGTSQNTRRRPEPGAKEHSLCPRRGRRARAPLGTGSGDRFEDFRGGSGSFKGGVQRGDKPANLQGKRATKHVFGVG